MGVARSFFWQVGFPVVNPISKLYWFWCLYVLLMDASYTAFVVPIAVGFNASDQVWNWTGYFDFIAGDTMHQQFNDKFHITWPYNGSCPCTALSSAA